MPELYTGQITVMWKGISASLSTVPQWLWLFLSTQQWVQMWIEVWVLDLDLVIINLMTSAFIFHIYKVRKSRYACVLPSLCSTAQGSYRAGFSVFKYLRSIDGHRFLLKGLTPLEHFHTQIHTAAPSNESINQLLNLWRTFVNYKLNKIPNKKKFVHFDYYYFDSYYFILILTGLFNK